MKNQAIKLSLAVCGFCLATSSVQAETITLLDQNFDAGMPSSAQTLGGSSVNLRSGTNAVNTYNAGIPNQRFSLASGTTFFDNSASNQFLVLGDASGQLAGSPDNGTFGFAQPFTLASGTTDITVSFDWVFSAFVLGGTGGSTDQFKVGISGASFDINSPLTTSATILDQSVASAGKVYGPDSVTLAVASLGAADVNGNYWLSFGLFENTGTNPTTNSGVGIDNIKITANVSAVPLPAAVWMFLSGFVGMLTMGRRKQNLV
ncbi:hypothetical protein A1359_15405 [Methylomonas lenta]|uniref:Uncharacterized protein n=1 Tax=Methylomonas lenta TaxID=980561 RepID=A0A177MZ56_9GAMM|nr:VPLPA-CTERM sorting domain-containing protein [Methylomonas lenta]OAI10998.1 hypothetical protein A1359_15405 [Methylomonas lenta]